MIEHYKGILLQRATQCTEVYRNRTIFPYELSKKKESLTRNCQLKQLLSSAPFSWFLKFGKRPSGKDLTKKR